MSLQITKLFRPYNGEQTAMAQVYENSYTSNLQKMNELADILKKDFPGIKDEDIKFQKFGGIRIKGIPFVEVQLGEMTEIPKEYDEVKTLEFIL